MNVRAATALDVQVVESAYANLDDFAGYFACYANSPRAAFVGAGEG